MKSLKQLERVLKIQNVYVSKDYQDTQDFNDDTLIMLNEIENFLLIKRKEIRQRDRNRDNKQYKDVQRSYTTS